MRNMIFHGETEVHDCPSQGFCANERNYWDYSCIEKAAIMPSNYAHNPKPALIEAMPPWPQYKVKGDASFGGQTFYNNMTFINFKAPKDWCGND